MKAICKSGFIFSRLPQTLVCVGMGLVASLSLSVSVQAQPALQNAIVTDRGAADRRTARATGFGEVEGVEVGLVRFSIGASYSVEFNDNVTTSEKDPSSDFIQTPSVNLGVDVPISQRSDLAFQVGVGYRAYWHNDALSRWTITPGSVLAYDLQVKNVFITLFDRLSYTESVYTAPDLANQAQFPRLDNTIGTQATWMPGNFLIAGGYSYQITHSTSDEYSYVNRTSHLPFLRTGYVFANGAANAGLEFSVTFTDYESNTNSDNTIVSFGPYLDWQVSDAIHAAVRGGSVYTVNSLSLLPEDKFNGDSFYAGADVSHALTDHITHGLSINHGVRPSLQRGASITEETTVGYNASWAFIEPATLRFHLDYNHGRQSAATLVSTSETYDQWRIGASLSYGFTTRLSGDLRYDYVVRDSDQQSRSYTQNRVTLGLSYRFQ